MKTRLEEISAVKKKLSIEIESQEVDRKLNEAYREVGKKAGIPGFRPGKVPRKVLERYFGKQVVDDVMTNLVNETFPRAIEEVEAFPLGVPLLEKGSLKQGQDFKYTALMEVRPQFELKDYLGLEAEKERCSVTEEDAQNRLEEIRKAHGKLTAIEQDRPIKKDDYVVLEYEGFEEGQPLEGIKSTNFLLKVGSHDFHPAFEDSLIGLNKDDQKEIEADFEESYYHSRLAGKKVDFKVKIIDIKEMVLPELNDEFVLNLGADFKGLDELKNKVREALTAEEEKRIDRELKQRLSQKISESVDLELPEGVVESEINYAVENVKQNLIRGGSSLEKTGLTQEKLREDFRPGSEKRVKEMFILGEIAKREKITVDDEDLEKGFRELALSMGQSPEALREYYEARNLVDTLRNKLLEEKTLNYLVEHANIIDVEKGAISQTN
ncbi:MAG: trigger factor [Desulfobacteraceae bacterium]|nr:trigger factor [Desulfobacteraceae bacterium]